MAATQETKKIIQPDVKFIEYNSENVTGVLTYPNGHEIRRALGSREQVSSRLGRDRWGLEARTALLNLSAMAVLGNGFLDVFNQTTQGLNPESFSSLLHENTEAAYPLLAAMGVIKFITGIYALSGINQSYFQEKTKMDLFKNGWIQILKGISLDQIPAVNAPSAVATES